jgi:hypothetical protein
MKNINRQPASNPSTPLPCWISSVDSGLPITDDSGTARQNNATMLARCARGYQ